MKNLILMTLLTVLISSCGGNIYYQHIQEAERICKDEGGISFISRTTPLMIDICSVRCLSGKSESLSGHCS